MSTVYLALGSNVGDSEKYITEAIESLSNYLKDIRVAPIYVTRAMGYANQENFLNTAISGRTELSPSELLDVSSKIEKELGRIQRFKWGPREIDIDIIFFGDKIIKTDKLTIPHPYFSERDFVLQPIVDLEPNFIDPLSNKTVGEILKKIGRSELSIMDKYGTS